MRGALPEFQRSRADEDLNDRAKDNIVERMPSMTDLAEMRKLRNLRRFEERSARFTGNEWFTPS